MNTEPSKLPQQTTSVSLTRAVAAKIVEVVGKDATCKARINSSFGSLPAAWGVSGGLRNISIMGLDLFNPWSEGPSSDESKLVCTGIADATCKAINNAKIPYVKLAAEVTRTEGVYHVASGVTLQSGKTYVFDWHATLMIDNPLIYPSPKDFKKGSGAGDLCVLYRLSGVMDVAFP